MKNKKNSLALFFLFVSVLFISNACHPPRKLSDSKPAKDLFEVSTGNPRFLFLSDVHLDTTIYITPSKGDTGKKLWANLCLKLDSILSEPNPPRFIVYTGDLPAHYGKGHLDPSMRGPHNGNIFKILTDLRTISGKHQTPLFYLPGNNDGLAGDYYSFADEQQQTPLSLVQDNKNPYPALNILPGTLKAPCMVSNPHPTMGYYAVRPVDGLRLIALNTVIYDPSFNPVDGTNQLADGDTQMAWLTSQLAEAKVLNEKVYIAMHVPPGLDAYCCSKSSAESCGMWVKLSDQKVSWLNSFLTLTSTYQTTIAGILYGHTHMDELRRLYDPSGAKIMEVAISCPGITPQHHNNPGFKTVSYDAVSKELMDYTTYYSGLNNSHWGNNRYTFSATFGGKPGISIFQQLSGMSLSSITTTLNNIYTVKNGPPAYNVSAGIEVKEGQ